MGGVLAGILLFYSGLAFGTVSDVPVPSLTLAELIEEPSPKVLVRLKKNQTQILVKGYKISWGFKDQKVVPVSMVRPRHFRVEFAELSGKPLWKLSERNKLVNQYVGQRMSFRGKGVTIDGHQVPEQIHLIKKSPESFDVVAELDIEDYLKGVLPSEMPASWPIEAIKAQAVASRTYTLFNLKRNRGRTFHLEASVLDQVYNYSHPAHAFPDISQRVVRAIEETRGWVLMAKGKPGELIPAYYHADCGGETEEPHRVWNNHKVNGTVKDESCPLSPHGRWQKLISWRWLGQKIPLPKAPEGEVEDQWYDLMVSRRSSSGRALRIRLMSQRGRVRFMGSNELRKRLGYHRIKSTLFYLQKKDEGLLVYGRGHGHGVGMCQWGTRFLSGRGLKYKEILKHYYPQAEIKWMAPSLRAQGRNSLTESVSH